VLHPPTPYTLSPLPKGGEGRGEGGSYTHVPCPFGAPLVTLYHLKSKAFLMCGGGGHARLRGERQLHITLPSYIQKPFARNWYYREVQLAGWIVDRGGAHEPRPY